MYDELFYVTMLDRYIECGECPVMEIESREDSLLAYILSLMANPAVKISVLTDEVCAHIFYDSTLLFIRSCFEREKFNVHRNQAERNEIRQAQEWSIPRKKDGWQALLQKVDEKYNEYGFNGAFYRGQFEYGNYKNDVLWKRMLEDWENALEERTRQQTWKDLAIHKKRLDNLLESNMKNIPRYLEDNKVSKDEFMQCWGLMNGIWNKIDFERLREIVNIQKEFPVIQEVANRMGRIADDDGSQKIKVSSGNFYRFEYASGSDIEGITVGNDVSALLPIELAHCIDDKLGDLFIRKYLTNQLQVFRYKSETSNPSRSLQRKPARLKGPMIVCLDTSGSMQGKPEQVAHSLLVRLLEMADRQKRDCYLITFSVHIRCMDIRKERAKLLDMFSHTSCGDTDATRMLKAMMDLLASHKNYINADVLWITDFKIPPTSEGLLKTMQQYRNEGTYFYGMQIGISDNDWEKYFDRIFKVPYRLRRRF